VTGKEAVRTAFHTPHHDAANHAFNSRNWHWLDLRSAAMAMLELFA
jgi:hypothetical protein